MLNCWNKLAKFGGFIVFFYRSEKLSRKNSLDNQLQSQQPAFNNTNNNNGNKPAVVRKISPARRAAGRAAGWERFLGNNTTSTPAPTSLNYNVANHAKKLSDTAKPFEDDTSNVNNEEHVISKQLKPVGKLAKLWTEDKNTTQKVWYFLNLKTLIWRPKIFFQIYLFLLLKLNSWNHIFTYLISFCEYRHPYI